MQNSFSQKILPEQTFKLIICEIAVDDVLVSREELGEDEASMTI